MAILITAEEAIKYRDLLQETASYFELQNMLTEEEENLLERINLLLNRE